MCARGWHFSSTELRYVDSARRCFTEPCTYCTVLRGLSSLYSYNIARLSLRKLFIARFCRVTCGYVAEKLLFTHLNVDNVRIIIAIVWTISIEKETQIIVQFSTSRFIPCDLTIALFRINTRGIKISIAWQSCLRLNHLLSFRRRDRKEEKTKEGADRRKWRLSRNVSSHDVARPDIWSNNNTNFVYRGNLLSGRCVYSGCSPFIVRNIRGEMHACAGVGMCETRRFHGLHLFRQ